MSGRLFTYLCSVAFLFFSCSKEYRPEEVSGTWKSLHEVWVITENGESSNETYDYGDAPTEESAVLRLYLSDFDVFSRNDDGSKKYSLAYSDRFSPANGESGRVETSVYVWLSKNMISSSNTPAIWLIRKVNGDLMVMDYDNGAKGGDVRRQCRFVFLRVASGVTK